MVKNQVNGSRIDIVFHTICIILLILATLGIPGYFIYLTINKARRKKNVIKYRYSI
jgi:hypothetical protein